MKPPREQVSCEFDLYPLYEMMMLSLYDKDHIKFVSESSESRLNSKAEPLEDILLLKTCDRVVTGVDKNRVMA